MLIVANVASVLCGVKNNDEQTAKPKRGASIGTYSYISDHHLKYEGSRVKSLKRLKDGDHHDSYSHSNSKALTAVLFAPMLKTTVEYWPPDMDKEKFFSMRKDSEIQMWPREVMKDVTRVNQKVLPENLPDIPIKTVSVNSWSNVDDKNNFESLTSPTESSVPESVSVSDPGPVVFPTVDPTTKDPDQSIVYIARGGYKKRKLKKKAKTSAPFVETSPTKAPSTSTESEIKASDIYMPEVTPIYEVINESVVNIFPPVRYTDVVNNLSNLTEQSFGLARVNDSKKKVEIIINSKPMDDDNLVVDFVIGNTSTEVYITEESTTQKQEKSLNLNDIIPLEKLLNQLKQAIEERDVGKIKRIVELMEEPRSETVTAETTLPPKIETSSNAPVELSTEAMTKASSSIPDNKVYTAPRIRIAQKKLKPLNVNSPDDKLKVNSIPTLAETVASSSSTIKLMVTTEKIMSTSAVMSMIQARRPGRRGGRSQGSKQHSRVEHITTMRSRQAAKNVSRRIVNRNQS